MLWRNIIKNKIKYLGLTHIRVIDWHSAPLKRVSWHYDIPIPENTALVTAMLLFCGDIPELKRQLDDIRAQTYKYLEIIILVDSHVQLSLLQKHRENLNKDLTIHIVFGQKSSDCGLLAYWNQGIQSSNGKFIWILEPYEQYRPEFAIEMLKLLEHQSVLLAFCQPNGKRNRKKPILLTAPVFRERVLKERNLLKDAGGTVFRNPRNIPQEWMDDSREFKDNWLFSKCYLLARIIRGGCVGYTTEPLMSHLKQTKRAQDPTFKSNPDFGSVEHFFMKNSSPSVLMCCSDFMLGGGETFAIHLANELYRQGIVVTMIDFHMYQPNENIRRLLNPAVPVVKLTSLRDLGNVISQLDADVIHSHHGNVDEAVSMVLQRVPPKCSQFITLHGMYEAMPEADCRYLLKQVLKTCTSFVYIADKNLEPFRKYGHLTDLSLTRIGNGLPQMATHPVGRSHLGIPESSFILCLASRGIREKGWAEGIQIVEKARERCGKDIHLIILGDGEMRLVLEQQSPSFVHFMGTVFNVRDYFSMSDAGFLPSYFKGESFPLVVIEALMCGIPVIASDIGEIKNQLTDENNELAGALIPVCNWKLDIERAVQIVSSWAGDECEYRKCRQRVSSAVKKMDIQSVAQKYIRIYQSKGAADRA